jgi:hypothetical protein
MASDDLLLPEGSLLLHIGPFKTGTTAIQSAMREAAPALKKHGVTVTGLHRRNTRRAVLSITNNRGLSGDAPPSPDLWKKLVRQVNRVQTPRAVLSSEFFCDASKQAATNVIEAVGPDRVHVVVTVRPLVKILPSAWQQYVRNRLTAPYDEWLDAMFNREPFRDPTPSFWRRHRHDNLVAKWASIVGPDRVSVVIADDQDREGLSRAFEGLLGVPAGMLVPPPSVVTNRSLTAAEIELVRQINLHFKEQDWPDEIYHKFIRNSVVARLLRRMPEPDEPRILTPLWAQERAAATAAQSVQRFNALGVRVIGNPDSLVRIDPPPVSTGQALDLPVSASVGIVVALLYRAGLIEPPPEMVAEIDDTTADAEMSATERAARRTVRRWRRWRMRRRALAAAKTHASKVMPEPDDAN